MSVGVTIPEVILGKTVSLSTLSQLFRFPLEKIQGYFDMVEKDKIDGGIFLRNVNDGNIYWGKFSHVPDEIALYQLIKIKEEKERQLIDDMFERCTFTDDDQPIIRFDEHFYARDKIIDVAELLKNYEMITVGSVGYIPNQYTVEYVQRDWFVMTDNAMTILMARNPNTHTMYMDRVNVRLNVTAVFNWIDFKCRELYLMEGLAGEKSQDPVHDEKEMDGLKIRLTLHPQENKLMTKKDGKNLRWIMTEMGDDGWRKYTSCRLTVYRARSKDRGMA